MRRLVVLRIFFSKNIAVPAVALACASACVKRSAQTPPAQQTQLSTQSPPTLPPAAVEPAGLTEWIPSTERNELGKRIPDASLSDVFHAISYCDCMPQLQTALVERINTTRGALPQALTPAIRSEILGNSKLKLLEIIPRPLDNIVGGIFADETTVAEEVHSGLLSKIQKAEPQWQGPKDSAKLHLDAFVPLPGCSTSPTGRWVQLTELWSRWSLVLSQGGPWPSASGVTSDKGLLWNELLRLLAEGEYLFGLSGNGQGETWGGLTIPVDLQITHPGAFDPRTTINQVRFLTGILDVTLPSNNSLALARNGGERWTWRNSSVPLAEQAFQWWVSARLLHRLRPAQRGRLARYFTTDGLLPHDSYQLALLVLPALDVLLAERFIDIQSRSIQNAIVGQQVGGVSQLTHSKANPLTLSLLLAAMTAWGNELRDISDLQLSPETAKQLSNASSSLLRGSQLIVQNLLSDFIRPRASEDSAVTLAPWTLIAKSEPRSELSMRVHAQVLATLIEAEKTFMPSPYLRSRIAQLATGLAQRLEESEQVLPSNGLAESVWLRTALRLFLDSGITSPARDILSKHADDLQGRIDAFERSALP